MSGSCHARFLPRKLPQTVLLRTAAHDFFAEFACYAQDFFPVRAGAPQQRCAALIGCWQKVGRIILQLVST